MLNMNEIIESKTEVQDNEIAINGVVIGKLSNTEAQLISDIVLGWSHYTPYSKIPAPTSTKSTTKTKSTKSTPKRKTKSYGPAKDVEVKFTRKGATVYIDGYVARDTFTVLQRAAKTDYGVEWTKKTDSEAGHFTFRKYGEKTAVQNAKDFCETLSKVYGVARDVIRKEWNS